MRWYGYLQIPGLAAGAEIQRRRLPAATVGWVVRDGRVWDESPAAAAVGVRAGQADVQARVMLPAAERWPYQPARYRAATEAAWTVAAALAVAVEPLDERSAYLDLADLPERAVAGRRFLAGLADRGRPRLGLATSLLMARLALSTTVADLVLVAPAAASARLASASVLDLWPLPDPARRRLVDLGIGRVGELAALSRTDMERVLGRDLARLAADCAANTYHRSVAAAWPPREVVATAHWGPGGALWEAVAADLAAGLARQGSACTELLVELSGDDGPLQQSVRLSHPLVAPLALASRLRGLAAALPAVAVDQVRVRARGLVAALPRAIPLWAPSRPAAADLGPVLATLAARYGRAVVQQGVTPSFREQMLAYWDPLRAPRG